MATTGETAKNLNESAMACRVAAGLYLASEVIDMNVSGRPHRRRSGYHVAAALALGLALVGGGASWPGPVASTVSAQELNPCALLVDDE